MPFLSLEPSSSSPTARTGCAQYVFLAFCAALWSHGSLSHVHCWSPHAPRMEVSPSPHQGPAPSPPPCFPVIPPTPGFLEHIPNRGSCMIPQGHKETVTLRFWERQNSFGFMYLFVPGMGRCYLDALWKGGKGCRIYSGGCHAPRDPAAIPSPLARQVLSAEGMSLASRFGCLFHEVSACQDFSRVQHVFHEAVREVRRQAEWNLPLRPLFISEERPCPPVATPVALTTHHSLATCTFNTLSTVNYKEIPSVAQAKLVTVKSSRAQSKRKAPTLTLLKGFKIF